MPTALKDWMKFEYEPLSELNIPRGLLDPYYWWDTNTTATGSFYITRAQGGEKSGYFTYHRRWYSVNIVPNEPMKLTLLKGIRVKLNRCADGHGNDYMRITRTRNAQNISIL